MLMVKINNDAGREHRMQQQIVIAPGILQPYYQVNRYDLARSRINVMDVINSNPASTVGASTIGG